MVKLCDDYKVFGKNLNGKLCLGENIADYGGVKLAYTGLQSFQSKHGPLPKIDGFTAEQRFFLGWASIWRNNIREENAHLRVIMDPHAPGEFRANIVQVIEEFHDAFNVKEGDAMWQAPEVRCEIWWRQKRLYRAYSLKVWKNIFVRQVICMRAPAVV